MKHAEINNPREFQNDECQKPKAKSHTLVKKVKNGKQNSQFKILGKCHKATIRIKDGKLKSKIRITIKATLKAEDGNPEREKSGAKIGNKYGIPFGRKRTLY